MAQNSCRCQKIDRILAFKNQIASISMRIAGDLTAGAHRVETAFIGLASFCLEHPRRSGADFTRPHAICRTRRTLRRLDQVPGDPETQSRTHGTAESRIGTLAPFGPKSYPDMDPLSQKKVILVPYEVPLPDNYIAITRWPFMALV